MNPIDLMHLLWQGRWEGLVLLWNGIIHGVMTIWWFGPIALIAVIAMGRRGLLRLGLYVAKVFLHTHGPL